MNVLTVGSAFEILRQFKECNEETEKLVVAITRRKYPDITIKELASIFENGIAGEYGKFYNPDPQTLLFWIEKYWRNKHAPKNYLDSGLLPISTPSWETIEWDKEANKCYRAFLNGVSHEYFHRCVYDRMMVDGKIKVHAHKKYYQGNELNEIYQAQQKIIRDVFTDYKSKGFTTIYFIK